MQGLKRPLLLNALRLDVLMSLQGPRSILYLFLSRHEIYRIYTKLPDSSMTSEDEGHVPKCAHQQVPNWNGTAQPSSTGKTGRSSRYRSLGTPSSKTACVRLYHDFMIFSSWYHMKFTPPKKGQNMSK